MALSAIVARSSLAPRVVACLVGGTLLLELAAGFAPARAAPAGSTQIRLHDDDAGAALFASEGLHPGRTDHACVAVAVSGPADPADRVLLSTEVTKDDLAPYLMLTVERGNVGAFANCASFTGEELWRGTLADFPTTPSTGIVTGWRPGVVDRAVYRFTVTVVDDPGAQRRTAAATFVWTLDEAPRSPQPTPEPTPEPTPTPRPPVPSPPAEPVTAMPSPGPPAPGDTTPPAPPAAEPPPDAGDVVEAPPLPAGPSTVQEFIEDVAEATLSVVRDGHFPAALGAVLVVFLALQGVVDRRDPKLALARMQQDLHEFRPFPEPSRTENP